MGAGRAGVTEERRPGRGQRRETVALNLFELLLRTKLVRETERLSKLLRNPETFQTPHSLPMMRN